MCFLNGWYPFEARAWRGHGVSVSTRLPGNTIPLLTVILLGGAPLINEYNF